MSNREWKTQREICETGRNIDKEEKIQTLNMERMKVRENIFDAKRSRTFGMEFFKHV